MRKKTCVGCKHYLGGGQCRINLESECREGGGYEAREPRRAHMYRLTTDHPKNNFETMLNLVYGKDGWQYIRHGDSDMPTVDFCIMLCEKYGCRLPESAMSSNEAKDEWLCECAPEGCPIATVYAALSGFGHIRSRLKMYEDAGIMPPERKVDNAGE